MSDPTPEQIEREITDLGVDLPQDLGAAINSAANEVVERLKASAPLDTGSLKESIRAEFNTQDFTLGISMLDYGYFQNFGVVGTENQTTQFGVPDNVSKVLPPRSGATYSYDSSNKTIGGDLPFGVKVSIHQRGLNAKQFLDLESFVDRVANIVNENLNL